ncbi:MAG: 16S rRNA (cytosine(1402)-N(4))-methyltransferase RsmH [Clostridia bacterium]|nr:16S rRNA (cytosine(1402)-N(4))-methyltransferase RsmH [Clostridia bacterium]MBQ8029899.1 16S rRNA (cytosine(1402)-N(4))-methyltransferase RsmH [Clostridia bacterium]
MEFSHISVLLEETIESLEIKPDGIYVDCTAGGGGHSGEIAKRLTSGRLISIDRDPDAIEVLNERLGKFENITVVHSNYSNLKEILESLGIEKVDGVLADLGVSSHQLDKGERGFSFHTDAPLDMRMSQEGMTAADYVNTLDERALSKVIFEYGEEKFARNIARAIVREREISPIETTVRLAEIIKNAIPAATRRTGGHPARKTFQSLRILTNQELTGLSETLDDMFECLKVGGRLSIITFHSLEDRMVKQRFNSFCEGCVCPPEFPVCVCGRKPKGKLVFKFKRAGEKELAENPRSRSATLRCIERLED